MKKTGMLGVVVSCMILGLGAFAAEPAGIVHGPQPSPKPSTEPTHPAPQPTHSTPAPQPTGQPTTQPTTPPTPPPPPVDNRPVYDLNKAANEGAQAGDRDGFMMVNHSGSVANIIYNGIVGMQAVEQNYSDSALRQNHDAAYTAAASSESSQAQAQANADAQSAIPQADSDADALISSQEQTAINAGAAPQFTKPNPIVVPSVNFTSPSTAPGVPGLAALLQSSNNTAAINNFVAQMMSLEQQYENGQMSDGDMANQFNPANVYNQSLDSNSLNNLANIGDDRINQTINDDLNRGDIPALRDINSQNNGVDVYKNADDARNAFTQAFSQRFSDNVHGNWFARVANTGGAVQQIVQQNAQSILGTVAPQEDADLGAYDGYVSTYATVATSTYSNLYQSEYSSHYANQVSNLETTAHIANLAVAAPAQTASTIGDTVYGSLSAENLGGVAGTVTISTVVPTDPNSLYKISGASQDSLSIPGYAEKSTSQINIGIQIQNQNVPDMDVSVPVTLSYPVGSSTQSTTQNVVVHLSLEALMSKIASAQSAPLMVTNLDSFLNIEWQANKSSMQDRLSGHQASAMLIRRMTTLVSSLPAAAQASFKTNVGTTVRAVYGADPGCSWWNLFCKSSESSYQAVDTELKKIGL